MRYYEIWVSGSGYHGKGPLTYSAPDNLGVGSIVKVTLKNKDVLGWVVKEVKKPVFATKSIIGVIGYTSLPQELISLHGWIQEYYPAPLGQITSLFLPSYLSAIKPETDNEAVAPTKTIRPNLTAEQNDALQVLNRNDRSFIIHGVTGSGKTVIYAQLAAQLLEKGKSSLILTPEISLTPQLARDLQTYLGKNILVLHSRLTSKQRADLWHKVANAEDGLVIVGARSALFSPINNLGLIVIDEFHDQAYKQEQAPHYLTTRVAAKLAQLHHAKLVMGSATPSIDIYYAFRQKKLPIIKMAKPAIKSIYKPSLVKVVSLKDRDKFSRSTWISNELLDQIGESLGKKEQSLVFLNRRGTAKLALCQVCGWQALCPKCDIPLTYHGDGHRLLCHTCGHQETAPSSCPICQSTEIIFKGVGTKLIADELSRLFPNSRLQRFDGDNKKSERFDQAYNRVKAGDIDILVGTQILTKGLDLPRLSNVGIVVADSALSFPDFSAEEKTYQMLNQVMGRVGRGHRSSKIVIQTYSPNSPTILSAVDNDYLGFYKSQLQERQQFKFPPFVHLLKLSIAKANQANAATASQLMVNKLNENFRKIEIDGPAPALIEKARGKFNWQIVIKSKNRELLVNIIRSLPADWSYDIDPINLI